MKRRLFNLATALWLLVSLTAAAAWAMSYARPLDRHLLWIADSADLTRVDLDRRTVVVMMHQTLGNHEFVHWPPDVRCSRRAPSGRRVDATHQVLRRPRTRA